MTFTIPILLMWVIGIPLGLVIIFLAVIGIMFISAFKDGPFGR
ncbi:hypothetical protein [Paenibacillus albiflavus]|nr:hypothetical protein [Paenibacillus albiflavus]